MRFTGIALFGIVTALGGLGRAHRPIVPSAGYELELVCEGERCDEVQSGGQRWVIGEHGQRYAVRVVNRTDLWVEAVVAVDGRSVLDGRRIGSASRGYLIPPRDRIEIEGWRVSSADVAAFRFTSVGDSYVGRIGDPSQAGIVRVDFYPERAPVWIPPPPEDPWSGSGLEDDAHPRPTSEASRRGDAPMKARQDLGTQYGERRWQPVAERSFERANPDYPERSMTLRYDDRRGLAARGILRPWWRDEPRWVPPPPPRRPWIDEDDATRWVPPPPPE